MNRFPRSPLYLVLALAGLVAAEPVPAPAPAADLTAASARRVLEAYHRAVPTPAGKKLRIVCWRTREREFPADYHARLHGILTHIQQFYADEMERNGLGRLTFPLDIDPAGRLVIHEAVGTGTYDEYTKKEGGGPIRRDCEHALRAAGLDPERETYVIFTNLAKWDPVALTFSHHSPYMGSGTCRGGVAWQLDHPGLAVSNLTLKAPLIRDGEYGRISLGKHNSIFIGGIAHELGHALSLPHCRECAAEARTRGTALMGSGNRTYGDELRGEGRGSFLTLGSALRLASHPLFTRSARGLDTPAEARFSGLSVQAEARAFTVSGLVTAAVPVYAVIGYFDPDGDDDYDARTAVTAPRADGTFSLPCGELVAGRPAALRLVACLANGDVTTLSQSYRVAADGTPDLSVMEARFQLEPFRAALATNQHAAFLARDALPRDSAARRVANAVLAARVNRAARLAPAAVGSNVTTMALSRLAPVEARVGWGRPCYDFLPGDDPLLAAGGQLFESGIYAHAPARHRYELAGGWRRLTGTCGLPNGRGSVDFIIRADGREVFRSGKLEDGRTKTFAVDLIGVQTLELITDEAGDGGGSDWGLWLGAELTR